jgi:thiamine pyrophosphate-dependent acetolactate synthase large subunit-like protein
VKFHEAVARTLKDQGISVVFGVIGDGNLFMMSSFQSCVSGNYFSMANEASAVLASSGYARTSGQLGVASVTRGPGLTNTVTALIASVKDRTPLLLITGDTPVADRENFQNVAQRELVIATGAGFEQVRSPETVAEDVDLAIRRAQVERRPIVLNIPIEFQWSDVEYLPIRSAVVAPQSPAPDPESLDIAVGVIASARRPLILAGRGATSAQARAALSRLAKRIGAPVATTLQGKDLFRGDTFDLGVFGTLALPGPLEIMLESDCILAFGAGLNRYTTAKGSLLANKRVVQVDTRLESLNRHYVADVCVIGDTAATADAIVAWLDEAETPSSDFASSAMAERLATQSASDAVHSSAGQYLDIRTVLARIDELFPQDRSLVFDTGHFISDSFSMLHVEHPTACVFTTSYGCIGLGMGNAIGAYFGAPERPVLLVCGDGGFMLGGLTEFNTAVRHKVDIVVIVLNDGAYGAEYVQFLARDMDPSISAFEWPDLGPIATSLGGRGFTVRNAEQLDEALAATSQRDVPMLIDVKINRDKVGLSHG